MSMELEFGYVEIDSEHYSVTWPIGGEQTLTATLTEGHHFLRLYGVQSCCDSGGYIKVRPPDGQDYVFVTSEVLEKAGMCPETTPPPARFEWRRNMGEVAAASQPGTELN